MKLLVFHPKHKSKALITTEDFLNNYPHFGDFQRRKSEEVNIGNVSIGGENPILLQSMTTIDTMDTKGSIEQSIRMIDAGCELVRITAPSIKEAQNLQNIKDGLRVAGYNAPLVADIHFTPNAAESAARRPRSPAIGDRSARRIPETASSPRPRRR